MSLDNEQSSPVASVDVTFRNVSYEIEVDNNRHFPFRKKWRRTILHNVSGYVGAGESLAILGPSGSGKTTLLNLLAARSQRPPSSGEILFSGQPRVPRTKRHIGYVMQDDVFFSKLTVRETLAFTAAVRLPHHMVRKERDARLNTVIKKLGLEKCQDTRIGDQQFDKGISGGERKRLNVANELVHRPGLFLADECTSGLDSSSALAVIDTLGELCAEGHTVIITIHQPSSKMFSLFSKILILAAGRVAYFGVPHALTAYFEALDFPFPGTAYNPADYALEIVIDDQVKEGGIASPQGRVLDAWAEYENKLRNAYIQQEVNETDIPVDVFCVRRETVVRATSRNDDVFRFSDETDETTSSEEAHQHNEHQPTSQLRSVSSHSAPKRVISSNRPPPSTYAARYKRAVTKRAQELGHCLPLFHRRGDFDEDKGGDDNHDQWGVNEEGDKYTTSWWTQTKALAWRALRQKQGVLVQYTGIAQVIITTVLVLLFWFRSPAKEGTIEDRLGLVSFVGVNWAFYSISMAVFTFPAEKAVLNKDRASGMYRLSAYYFAKTIVEMPADMLYPLSSSLVIYYLVNMNPDVRAYILFNVITVLNVLIGQSIGLFVSATMMNVRQAQLLGSSWVLFSLMTSGYLIDPDNIPMPLQWVRYVNFLRYAYEGILRSEMSFGREYECETDTNQQTIYSQNGVNCPIDMDALLEGAQLKNALPIWASIGVQIIWIIILRVLGYFALKTLHTNHKPKLSSWKTS